MNLLGTYTLFLKEIQRFLKVYLQTVLAPVVNAVLFLVIFFPFGGSMNAFTGGDVNYSLFLLPGLIMMSVLQNAFANSSSSIIQAKNYGSIVFLLVAPLSGFETTIAYVAASAVRGLMVALVVLLTGLMFTEVSIAHPFMALFFILISGVVMGCMGLVIGILAKNFDHLSGFQHFVVLPLTFLSGVFYSTQRLPEFWYKVSHINPLFYMIDGLRYCFIGKSDIAIHVSIAVVSLFAISLFGLTWFVMKNGFGVRA